ncbi:MAG: polymer-forming cytoskeletal protein [Candidatus Latescibacteria bacterium]|nr:polymer-forming cytoskeletal protein [Candidatus Latescibacterota bacterium]
MLGKKESSTAASSSQTLNTIIGRGTLFEGVMRVENSVRIDGTFKGELVCSGVLTISQSGEVYAQLEGKEVYLNGVVRGHIHAEKVRLDSQARFVGDVTTSALAISEGAVFHGKCSMESGELAALYEKEFRQEEPARSPEPIKVSSAASR